MKIVFVNRFYRPDISATSQMTAELAEGLSAFFKVEVITSRSCYDDPSRRLPAREVLGGVTVRRVWSTRFGRGTLAGRAADYLTFYAAAFFCMRRVLEKGDILIAETDPPLISVFALRAAGARGARLVNWVQDLFPEVSEALGVGNARSPLNRTLKKWRNASFRKAFDNIALSRGMADRIRQAAPGAPVSVIPNWADGAKIRPVAPIENALRREWQLSDKFVVCYSGNLGRAHEIDTMVGAAERLREHPSIRFLFIGGGYQWPKLRKAVSERSLTNVIFHDYRPASGLSESLSAADVHLVSLRPEAESLVVPSKLYGILAAGRPAIYIGKENSEEAKMLSAARAGFGVPAGRADLLAGALTELAADLDRTRAMGLNARHVFDENFDAPIALRAWMRTLGRP